MSIIFSILSVLFFGVLAIIFSLLWERSRKKLSETERELGRQLFELSILREVSDKIGYSLKTRDIARTIVLTAGDIFPVKSASYAILEDGKVVVETFMRGEDGGGYLTQARQIILNAVYGIDHDASNMEVEYVPVKSLSRGESDAKVNSNTPSDPSPKSYFNIPLVLNNRFVGIISITSPVEKNYQDKDMSMLYKIVNQAQVAIGKLENVLETEKGKIESLIYSLSSGALLFMIDPEEKHLRLVTINNAARSFLHLEGPIDADIVFSKFKIEGNILEEVQRVMQEKKIRVFRGVLLFERNFNLYISPVFNNASMKVIGVAITMQDVSLEYETEHLRENFTNMVVHELRAPLTSIKGSAELLSKGDLSDEDKKKMFESMIVSTDRMLNDINQLLDAAKIQAGKFEIDLSDGDIMKVIEERVKMFKILAEKRDIRLDFIKDDEVPTFAFDSIRIGQILNNLLSNAVKYSNAGGEITVHVTTDSDVVRIAVSDRGNGIPKELQQRLFTRFYQASIAHRASGTGLGLYITKAIVDAHKGRIWMDSKEGEGTTVTFELPLRTKN